jgi:hypothetical protein
VWRRCWELLHLLPINTRRRSCKQCFFTFFLFPDFLSFFRHSSFVFRNPLKILYIERVFCLQVHALPQTAPRCLPLGFLQEWLKMDVCACRSCSQCHCTLQNWFSFIFCFCLMLRQAREDGRLELWRDEHVKYLKKGYQHLSSTYAVLDSR